MIKLIRLPEVMRVSAYTKSRLYKDIQIGLFPPPVKISERASGWPEHEVETMVRAIIAGNTSEEKRGLVQRLLSDRESKKGGDVLLLMSRRHGAERKPLPWD